MKKIQKSNKLDDVCYDIRGPVLGHAKQMEEAGHKVIKMNIGNPAAFGFEAPDEITQDVIRNMSQASGYTESHGFFAPRKSIMHYVQEKQIKDVDVDDIIIGNGVSELIVMAMQGLINNGDEVLIPMPDYPLWTAAVRLAGGKPVHYVCDEKQKWYPDLNDIKSKVTSKTKAIVVINPNNPTGSLYPDEILKGIIQIARENNLIVMADEIYDKVLYDGNKHTSIASLADDIVFLTFNGLSKNYRACGYRAGWLILSGDKKNASDYLEGLNMLASMRLCSNVPGQLAIQTALGGYQSINDLVAPGGRLARQRDLAYDLVSQIPGVSCVKPDAAMYLFPRLDPKKYKIDNDQDLILKILIDTKVLLVQGSGFNWCDNNHFRVVFLPDEDNLKVALTRLNEFFTGIVKQ
ncbi:aminotransferase [Methylophilales bacterium MBRSG12]|uniref:alanine transaminase n=1 Tax=Methylophilales bacterium MBRS-H7 TaxID=1623450 RepID=A0A0H4JA49_9PROT|nr:aminotransferase [Methylophilales bacterium MBRSF5]AKO65372.1 aminotransferase [Methylophilales bacterium MBRS-H7]AKO66691.1 aminotransferase [Methylophilales bacterium MBRSG12]